MASDGSTTHGGHKSNKKSDSSMKTKGGDAEESEVQLDIERLTASGYSALQQGDCAEALDCFKKAFKAAVELKETRVQRACAFNLGAAYVEAGKPQKGLDFLSRAQPGERGQRVADLQFNLGVAHEALEDHVRAAGHYLQAAQLYRSQGDGCSEGDTCMKLAHCHLRVKDWTQTAQSFQRAGESYRVAGRLDSAATALKEAGSHMLQCDHFTADDIITVLTECLELSVNVKDQETLGKLYNDVGLSFSQLKLFAEAAECYEQALPLAITKPRRLAVVLQNLGAVHNTLGQYQQALDYHREAATLHGSLGSRRAQGRCFSNLGYALSQQGELEEAGENYLHAQQAFKDTDDYRGQWQACEGLGEIRLRLRDPEKATLYFKQALALVAKCKDSPSSVQERLVNRLSDALQQRLSMQQRGPISRRAPQDRNLHRQPQRMADMKEAEKLQQPRRQPLNGHKEEEVCQVGALGSAAAEGEEWRTPGTDGGKEPHGEMMMPSTHSDSRMRGPHTAQPDYLTVLPKANRNLNNTYEKPDVHYQNLSDPSGIPPQEDHVYETIKRRSTEIISDLPLTQSSETSPTDQPDHEEATPLLRKWKSRFCSVM